MVSRSSPLSRLPPPLPLASDSANAEAPSPTQEAGPFAFLGVSVADGMSRLREHLTRLLALSAVSSSREGAAVPLIGLVGQKRSGKDSLASFLVADHGYTRLAFADVLKRVALACDPLVHPQGLYDLEPCTLADIVKADGWEAAKEYPLVRSFLQNLGVAVRDNLGSEAWIAPVRAAIEAAPGRAFVVTDVRFLNEVALIKDLGGVLVRVDRPGLPDSDGHISEHEWRAAEPDIVVLNDRSLEALAEQAFFVSHYAEVPTP